MLPKLVFRGPVLTASGYGVHARQLLKGLMAMRSFDISVISTNWGQTAFLMEDDPFLNAVRQLSAKYEIESRQEQRPQYDVSVQCTIPNEFQKLARINIGVTAGIEVETVSSEWLLKTNQMVDLLVVPSQHSADAFKNTVYQGSDGSVLRLQRPIVVVPEGVDLRYYNDQGTSWGMETFEFPADFNFLFVGLGLDKPLGEDRKNVGNLVKWFCERFKDDRKVGLVLKLSIVNGSLIDFETTKRRIEEIKRSVGCGEFPRIHLIHGRMPDEQMALLYKHPKIKAMISLTHGEGYGLPLIEAAACGLPIMATNWSGHLDFLRIDGKNKFVSVDYELKEVPESAVWNGVIERGTKWAYPKEDDVKAKLKKLVLSYEKPKEWADELGRHIREKYDLQKVAYQFCKVLADFIGSGGVAEQSDVEKVKKQLEEKAPGKKRLLYTMPMSAGDVYISTAVVNSLRKKYPDHAIFFATDPKYMSILKDNPDVDVSIGFEQWMLNVPILEQLFDEVYTPNINIQMSHANWVHKGKGRLLGDEMAVSCNVKFGDYFIKTEEVEGLPKQYIVVSPGSGKGQWEARNYLYWQDVISNLRRMGGFEIVQVGTTDDPLYKDVVDFRGKTTYNQLAYVVEKAECVVGIDTVTSHLAAGFGTPQVTLYGSSYSTSTGPVFKEKGQKKELTVLMDTPSRYSCDRACYKYQCSVDKDKPCINEISARSIVEASLKFLGGRPILGEEYKEEWPSISGYIHILNPDSQGFPYVESIRSMLGFCDEVVVVDGGSTDGSLRRIETEIADGRVKLISREWDWNEPGMDGMQKAFGRAMCTGDFLWQQDADEVVHEEDYEKIRKLTKIFPKDVDLIHLPVVELWGDGQTVRTDRHAWKWRLSRNDFRITHGINKHARVFDEKTGKTYAKKGMSDGCEYVDIMTGEYIPHKGFWNQQLEQLRQTNPTEYGRMMNQIFKNLPVVYHYSWADLQRKVRNFRDFWDKCWSNLYNETDRPPRFPSARDDEGIEKTARFMLQQGGEHGHAPTFKLERSNPFVMAEWVAKIKPLV